MERMDRLSLMTAFARVAETRSFTKAAERLGVSRATVSVSIRELEEHLGARLLHRTTRSVSLTPEGELYHARVIEILAQVDTSEQLFRRGGPDVSGRLVVDVPTRIARRVIIPALPDLLARHPGLEIHVGASDLAVDLVARGVDAVVRVGRLRDSSLIARPLGTLAQVNCGSPRYVARAGSPSSLEHLASHAAVGYGARTSSETTWDYVEEGEERSAPIRCVVGVDNAETYIAAALAGLGLIQIPEYDVRHHLESGALVTVMPRFVPAPLPISLVYPSRRQVPARVEAFAAWLGALLAARGVATAGAASPRPIPQPRRRR